MLRFACEMLELSELQMSSLLKRSGFSRADAIERGRRWRIRRMSRMWKWRDLDTEVIWLEKYMSDSNITPRFREEELTGMITLQIDQFKDFVEITEPWEMD